MQQQTAKCTREGRTDVLYRHSETDGTKFATKGELLPDCPGGIWEPLASDNLRVSDTIPIVIVRNEGNVEFHAGFLPENGCRFNLKNTDRIKTTLPDGLFQITGVREKQIGEKRYSYQVLAERLGEIDPSLLIYKMCNQST